MGTETLPDDNLPVLHTPTPLPAFSLSAKDVWEKYIKGTGRICVMMRWTSNPEARIGGASYTERPITVKDRLYMILADPLYLNLAQNDNEHVPTLFFHSREVGYDAYANAYTGAYLDME